MKIQIQDDFDPGKIMDSGQCFRACRLSDGCYRFITGRNVIRLAHAEGNCWAADCTPYAWKHIWHPYFDLDTDYREVRRAIPSEDQFLSHAAEYGKGIRILRQDPFEMLITFIISQRKSIPAIRSAVEALCRKAGTPIRKEEDLYAFPSLSALKKLSLDDLKACSLGYRAKYIYDAVRCIMKKEPDLSAISSLSDQELAEQLISLPGVGVKVSGCISLFAYHRTSFAPVDVWIERVIRDIYGGTDPFGRYGSHAGIIQQYMFFYAQTNKLKQP